MPHMLKHGQREAEVLDQRQSLPRWKLVVRNKYTAALGLNSFYSVLHTIAPLGVEPDALNEMMFVAVY